MSNVKDVIVEHVCFSIKNTAVNFDNLSIKIGQSKAGVVGDNGIGKTTLFQLISGILVPHSGRIKVNGSLSYFPQNYAATDSQTITDVLGVQPILEAIKNIKDGNLESSNFELADNNWAIEDKIKGIFAELNLEEIPLDYPFNQLSGGQKTKVLLGKTFLSLSDFILLDEPTNNLDLASREKLYHFIEKSDRTILVISHDRKLLNKVDEVIELTTKGLFRYGGNYDHYALQKEISINALQHDLEHTKRELKNAQISLQQSKEKKEQKKSKGRHAFLSGKIDKATANSKRGRSEKFDSRLATMEERLLEDAKNALNLSKAKIEFKNEININLEHTYVPAGKMVLDIDDLTFSYDSGNRFLLKNFKLQIRGPERIALTGDNGAGKTTLVKLILGQLKPNSGEIKLGVDYICYLDQNVDFLQSHLSLVDNFKQHNPSLCLFDAYSALAAFNFRNKEAEKITRHLSGGEKIRAGLACSLIAKTPPQLIILDEPTNHLDIRSIEHIESILNCFQGGMLVISHDSTFLKNIGVDKYIKL